MAVSLARALGGLGMSARVAGVASGDPGPGLIALPSLGRFHGTPFAPRIRPLWRALGDADVVHVLGYRDPVGTSAALGSRARGVRYLLEPCGMHRVRLRSRRLKRAFDAGPGRLVVGGAARIVATSRLEAAELVADGVSPERIAVRPNAVELDGILPLPERGALRARFGIPPDRPLVLSLGRIAAKKGLLELTAALSRLPDVHLLVAGPDDRDGTLDALLARRRDFGLEARLHLIARWMENRDKAQAFADADVFCLPSATENFGIAAAEAATVGLPVIVSTACGVAEFLNPGSGRVVPYGDVGALAGALQEMFSRDVRCAAIDGAESVRESLDWGRIARQQLDIYEPLLR